MTASVVPLREVVSVVAQHFGVATKRITSRSQHNDAVTARSWAMVLYGRWNKLTSVEVGKAFKRDHSTVLAAYKRVDEIGSDLEQRLRAQVHVKQTGPLFAKTALVAVTEPCGVCRGTGRELRSGRARAGLLHCPKCGCRHVDEDKTSHVTHKCDDDSCGYEWTVLPACYGAAV